MEVVHRGIKRINLVLPVSNHWLALFALIPVGLCTGTLFVFSVYSTQLGDQCGLDSRQISNLNILCTIGSSVGSIIGGIITDYYGSQMPMLLSSITLSWGYYWLYTLYSLGTQANYVQLLISMFLIGIGSVAGYFSAIKAVTLHFPNFKGSAQSITIASFAISSLLFSYYSNYINDTQLFLKHLSIICGLGIFIGFLFIRIDGSIDNVVLHDINEIEHEVVNSDGLLSHHIEINNDNIGNNDIIVNDINSDQDLSKSLKNFGIKKSLLSPIFLYHYGVFAIIQGLGQMYIFSIGYILKAIHYKFSQETSLSLSKLQSIHVSIISISSFIGRLSSGPESDFLVHKLKLERHWIIILGLVFMFTGHTLSTIDINNWPFVNVQILLLIISMLIGYSYGFSFTSYPAILSDIFNMKYYSLIWGTMYTATSFGLTLMSKLFASNYDSNTSWDEESHQYICKLGSNCYHQTFIITSCLCVVSAGLILGYIFHSRKVIRLR